MGKPDNHGDRTQRETSQTERIQEYVETQDIQYKLKTNQEKQIEKGPKAWVNHDSD